jgi:hypothetical protein
MPELKIGQMLLGHQSGPRIGGHAPGFKCLTMPCGRKLVLLRGNFSSRQHCFIPRSAEGISSAITILSSASPQAVSGRFPSNLQPRVCNLNGQIFEVLGIANNQFGVGRRCSIFRAIGCAIPPLPIS